MERYLHLDFSKGKSVGHYIAQGLKTAWLGLSFIATVPLLIARGVNRHLIKAQVKAPVAREDHIPVLNKQQLKAKIKEMNSSGALEGTEVGILDGMSLTKVKVSDLQEGAEVFVSISEKWQRAKYIGKYKDKSTGKTYHSVAFKGVKGKPDKPYFFKTPNTWQIFKSVD